MKLEYIAHSCFTIETGQKTIVFDPWITKTAYQNQWHLFPQPVNKEPVKKADIVLISHGHEDHLNKETLSLIQKQAHVFFPFQWREGIVGYLNHLGFSKITEAINFKTFQVENIRITYLGYSLESVIVVECENFVIVNINDALNSNHETAVSFLLNQIKKRWPKIDFLLSGWSGAGYFPNKVHFNQKDDKEIAIIREQYFANNFCRFTQFLQPEIAIAFAPGFVLLQNENRWINEIKFPREIITSYYQENFDAASTIQFPLTYPGDYFLDKTFHKVSDYHGESNERAIYQSIDTLFKHEIEQANTISMMLDEELEKLIPKLKLWLDKNKSLYHSDVIEDAIFSLRFTDVKEGNYLNISFKNGEAIVLRNTSSLKNDRLLIKTKANLLSLNLDKIWGGDLLSIGYGIDIDVFEELTLEKNLDIVCVRLISRFPNFKDDFIKHTPRILKYYFTNPSLTNLWINQKIKLRPFVNKYPFNERDHWLTYKKCDLCKVCNMPQIDFESILEGNQVVP